MPIPIPSHAGLVLGTPLGEQIGQSRSASRETVIEALSSAFRSELGLPDRPLAMQAILFEAV